MLELLYSSGLRLAELQGLTIKDIDFNRHLVRITGKGNKTRIVPFGKKAKESLLNWLKVYKIWKGHFDQNAFVLFHSVVVCSLHDKLKTSKTSGTTSRCKCRLTSTFTSTLFC